MRSISLNSQDFGDILDTCRNAEYVTQEGEVLNLFNWFEIDVVEKMFFLQDVFGNCCSSTGLDTVIHTVKESIDGRGVVIPVDFAGEWLPFAYSSRRNSSQFFTELASFRFFIVKKEDTYPVYYIDVHNRQIHNPRVVFWNTSFSTLSLHLN
ncbi:MAG: hypothetical protein ACQEQ4_08160 [Fibrobacterota bacterium]